MAFSAIIKKYENINTILKEEICRLADDNDDIKIKFEANLAALIKTRKYNNDLLHDIILKDKELKKLKERIADYEITLERNAQEKGDYGWLQRAAREQAERNKNKKILESALQMTTTTR